MMTHLTWTYIQGLRCRSSAAASPRRRAPRPVAARAFPHLRRPASEICATQAMEGCPLFLSTISISAVSTTIISSKTSAIRLIMLQQVGSPDSFLTIIKIKIIIRMLMIDFAF